MPATAPLGYRYRDSEPDNPNSMPAPEIVPCPACPTGAVVFADADDPDCLLSVPVCDVCGTDHPDADDYPAFPYPGPPDDGDGDA